MFDIIIALSVDPSWRSSIPIFIPHHPRLLTAPSWPCDVGPLSPQQTLLAQSWPNADPVSSTLAQRGPNVPCYLGCHVRLTLPAAPIICQSGTSRIEQWGGITEKNMSESISGIRYRCVTREMRAVFSDVYMRHQAKICLQSFLCCAASQWGAMFKIIVN